MPGLFLNKFFFNIILLFTFHKLFIHCEKDCLEYTDCFNCTMCGDINSKYCNCLWTTTRGRSKCLTDEFRYLSEWHTELTVCKNNEDQNLYCSGQDTIYSKADLDSYNSITFQINRDSKGNYGKKMLFCYYNYFDETANDYSLNIQFSNSIENKPKVAYGCSFNDSTQEKIQIIEENIEISCSGSNNIFFMALFPEKYSTSPLLFKIALKNPTISKYVAVFSLIILLLLLIIFIICCITRIYNNKVRRQLRMLMNQRARENMIRIEQENNNMEFEESEKIEKTNRLKLDELFSKQMAEHTYKSEYNKYGGGCSICLEDFKKKSKVSKTPCNHIFHIKCIKDWLYNNIKNPKCPNCNKEVVSEEKDEKIDEANIIKGKKNPQTNSNNNILNNNLNFGGRNNNNAVTININRRTGYYSSDVRGDLSQSQRQQLGNF